MHPPAPRAARATGRSFRLSTLQRVLPVALGFPGATVVLFVCRTVTGDPMRAAEWGQLAGWSLFGVAAVALLRRDRGALLTEDALVVMDGRRRRIPWTGISRLEVRRTFGVSQVVAHTRDGRRTTLPAPMSFLDARFEEKARELTEWWRQRRGPGAAED
ncbi:hypothetical protein ACFY30_25450 [Streptomyces sp. NPDC000345]|uniref:hypothetical protein n=1 Tax=Streptomyces sp. NPDC000345 TaxID=3364537 RepID=UPI00367629B5